MHPTCRDFVRRALDHDAVAGKRVLEVGSYDVNGSVRAMIESLGPSEYVGVDIAAGPNVDEVCPAESLLERFGPESFDVVLTTEMLEHVVDWRAVVHNLKSVLRPQGLIVLTTRAPGFAIHAYPVDYWRYNLDDMSVIFSDMTTELAERDEPADPGVFLRVRRPEVWVEKDLSGYRLYSIARRRRARDVRPADRVIVSTTMAVQKRLPPHVWFGFRFAANLVGTLSAERQRSGSSLMSNMHWPY